LKIRIATVSASDIKAIVKIAEENFITPWTENAITESIRENNVYIAITENSIIGYIIIHDSIDTIEIMSIAVDEKFKRNGVGKALIDFVIERYGNFEKEIWLEVRDNNEAAIALYKGCGFENISVRKGFYRDETPPRDALTMKYRKNNKLLLQFE
jgi:ribosomal-protein-alanine N-acetyltransferase